MLALYKRKNSTLRLRKSKLKLTHMKIIYIIHIHILYNKTLGYDKICYTNQSKILYQTQNYNELIIFWVQLLRPNSIPRDQSPKEEWI